MSSRPRPFLVTLSGLHAGAWRTRVPGAPWADAPGGAHPLWTVRERERFLLRFEAQAEEARLWVEGIEEPLRSGASLMIPSLEDQEADIYPWYPGAYELRVDWGSGVAYGLLEVLPKELSTDDLRDLRRDLEELVAGLSLDLSTRGYVKVEAYSAAGALQQLALLRQAAEELGPVLRQIEAEPQRALGREYALLPLHRARRLDHRSARWLARSAWLRHKSVAAGGEGPQVILAPQPQPSYDTYENRVIAWVLERLGGRARRLAVALQKELAGLRALRQAYEGKGWAAGELKQREAGFQRMERLAERLAREFVAHRGRPHLAAVGLLTGLPRPTVTLQKESRYRQVYAWYRRLERAEQEVPPEESRLQVKRTALLYEYWTLFRLLHLLTGLGYQLEGGRLTDQLRRANRGRMIPVIPEGESFWLSGPGDRRIALTYDGALPQTQQAALKAGQSLYLMSPHHRPDLRIDLYQAGAYTGSILIDAKYSSIWNLWPSGRYGGSIPQLQAYAVGLRHLDRPREPATKTVLVLYPGRGGTGSIQAVEGGLIHLVPLRPGLAHDELLALLRQLVGDPA
jgi:hypothetical protein